MPECIVHASDISRIEQKLDDICRELIGAQQPGRIQRIEARADEVLERVKSLESSRDRLTGFVVGLAKVIGVLCVLAGVFFGVIKIF
jgi:tetrahydromethanopterin S-methyltransferase subunit G